MLASYVNSSVLNTEKIKQHGCAAVKAAASQLQGPSMIPTFSAVCVEIARSPWNLEQFSS